MSIRWTACPFIRNKIGHAFVNSPSLSKMYGDSITVLKGEYLFSSGIVILLIKERSCIMFVIPVVVTILLLALAGSDLFIAQYSPDELSNMGVQDQ